MTYYHDIVNVLDKSDRPLKAKEIHEEIGGHQNKVYQLLKRMREKNKVIVDRDYQEKGVRTYQLRKSKASHLI